MSSTARRAAHQPHESVAERPPATIEDLVASCGSSLALIVADQRETTPVKVTFEDAEREPVICGPGRDDHENGLAPEEKSSAAFPQTPRALQQYEGRPLVWHVARTAQKSCFQAIGVLVKGDESFKDEIAAVVRDALTHDEGSTPDNPSSLGSLGKAVTLISYDQEDDWNATRKACNFELFGMTKGVLEIAYGFLDDHPEADSVVFLACDQVRISPYHLCEIGQAFHDGDEVDAVVSWIEWLRRTPLLVPRRFFEDLPKTGWCEPRIDSAYRPLPHMTVKEVVFGEEKLASNPAISESSEAFFSSCTLSALEAVRIAREQRAIARQKRRLESGRSCKRLPDSKEQDLSVSDEILIALAHDVNEELEREIGSIERRGVARADAWAHRNKSDFPLLNDEHHGGKLVYLDSAATTQRPFPVIQAQYDFDTHENANVYRGAYDLSKHATDAFNKARRHLEEYLGADRRQTVFTANASAACALVAEAWGTHNIKQGDLIVVGLAEHHSNLLPWLMLAQRVGARIAYIPILEDGSLDLTCYKRLLKEKPKLVCISHVSNVLGLINPIQTMASAAHRIGARIMVDAAQSFPHIPLDVKKLKADFVAFSGHKAYGPLGIGGLWISPEAFREMDPLVAGGGTISHAAIDSYYLRAGAIQYELGTPPIVQAIGLDAALTYREAIGLRKIEHHDAEMTRYLLKGLRFVPGATVWGDHEPPHGSTGLVSFSLAGIAPLTVAGILAKLNVAIRSGGHCALPLHASMGLIGTSRISTGVYTSCEDIEAALVALRVCWALEGIGENEISQFKAPSTKVFDGTMPNTPGAESSNVELSPDASASATNTLKEEQEESL